MAKKFITLCLKLRRYRIYSKDIRMVYTKTIRKIPSLPSFFTSSQDMQEDSVDTI